MIDVIVSGGLNITVEDTGDIINVTVEVAPSIAVEVVVGIPTKESIVGLAKDDSPEFADVVIPEIADESSYTAQAWAWLTGLFGAVTGSVKAMLVGLVEGITSIDERVVALEDNVLADIALDNDVISLDINLQRAEFDIEVEVSYTANTDIATNASVRVNGVTSFSYISASNKYSGFISYIARHSSEGLYRFTVMPTGRVFCSTKIQQIWGTDTVQNISSRTMNGYLSIPQLEGITKVSFDHPINAGSRFIVRRVKKHE
jgi:hypothetical protein